MEKINCNHHHLFKNHHSKFVFICVSWKTHLSLLYCQSFFSIFNSIHYDATMKRLGNSHGKDKWICIGVWVIPHKLVTQQPFSPTCLERNTLYTYSVMGEDEWTIKDGGNNNLFWSQLSHWLALINHLHKAALQYHTSLYKHVLCVFLSRFIIHTERITMISHPIQYIITTPGSIPSVEASKMAIIHDLKAEL